tara:strand:- start:122 stop:1108 length:987 start_codon:yes stop_codon:yes gene_type:complete
MMGTKRSWNKNSETPRDYSKEHNPSGSKEQEERNKRKRDKRKHDKIHGECPEGTELHHTNGIENDEVECTPVSKNRGRKEKSRKKEGEIIIRIRKKNSGVKKLSEGYIAGQHLAEEIWGGKFIDSNFDRQRYISECNDIITEGILQTFGDVIGYGKQKFRDYQNVANEKLEGFIDKGLELITNFLEKGREMVLKSRGTEISSVLKKIFPKWRVRDLQALIMVLRKPMYIKVGAAIISMILQKAAKLGINSLLDALSGGSASAAKIINFLQENIDKIKLFVESMMDILDPQGILDSLENLANLKKGTDIYNSFKSDLELAKNPFAGGFG